MSRRGRERDDYPHNEVVDDPHGHQRERSLSPHRAHLIKPKLNPNPAANAADVAKAAAAATESATAASASYAAAHHAAHAHAAHAVPQHHHAQQPHHHMLAAALHQQQHHQPQHHQPHPQQHHMAPPPPHQPPQAAHGPIPHPSASSAAPNVTLPPVVPGTAGPPTGPMSMASSAADPNKLKLDSLPPSARDALIQVRFLEQHFRAPYYKHPRWELPEGKAKKSKRKQLRCAECKHRCSTYCPGCSSEDKLHGFCGVNIRDDRRCFEAFHIRKLSEHAASAGHVPDDNLGSAGNLE